MARKPTLGDLRNNLVRINREIVQKSGDGQVGNVEILQRFKSEHSAGIAALNSRLIDIALTKLLNEVAIRRRRNINQTNGRDLFGEIKGVPQMLSIRRGVRKAVLKMSIAELASWIKTHDAKAVDDKNKGLKQLLAECREHMKSEDETLEAALERGIAKLDV